MGSQPIDLDTILTNCKLKEDPENICQDLYAQHLNKFSLDISEDRKVKIVDYQSKVFMMIDQLRGLDHKVLDEVLTSMLSFNSVLVDLVIIMWCLPDKNYLSNETYLKKYTELIATHNKKLVDFTNHVAVKQFCSDVMSRPINIPVHCLDLIWNNFINEEVEFDFGNSKTATYVGVSKVDSTICLVINLEFVLKSGVGYVASTSNQRMIDFLHHMCINSEITAILIKRDGVNSLFATQVAKIRADPKAYFKN